MLNTSSYIVSKRGQVSVIILFFASITIVVITGFVFIASSSLQLSARALNKLAAFSIAEAGINYYRWHLAHAPQDFQDGTGESGPYTHNYYDKDGSLIGHFILEITPPPLGSTVVKIKSTGKVTADDSIAKIIEVKLAIESFTKYAAVINSDLSFGTGTVTYGEIFSNGGIHFDGLAYNLVQSARNSYDDPDHGGGNEFGVHTHLSPIDPMPPNAVPSRPDVFMAGRAFPVSALDFSKITQDLAIIKSLAQTNGIYVASSSAYGYDLALATSGIYSLYKVTSLIPPPNGCTNTSNEPGWGTWSIQNETLIATGTIPLNGVIFVEDNLWVRGQVNNNRITIASGKFPDNPSTRTNIIVNQDLLFTDYSGTDAIGLIAQNNIYVGLFSNDVLRIDGALVAQNGKVGRHYYAPPNTQSQANKCGSTATRQRITLYGSVISNQRYNFGFNDSTGYQERYIIYDANLLYSPPPGFPLSGDQYKPISWDEIQ
jgi:hypothetical protein